MIKKSILSFFVLISIVSFLVPVARAPINTGCLEFSVFIQPSERSEYMSYFGKRTAHFSTDFNTSFDLGWDSSPFAPYKIVYYDLTDGFYEICWIDKNDDWDISYSHDEILVESGIVLRVNALIERAYYFDKS